nr:MAG TPA: hypothetical protein [Caudoviricetes sp.]
MNSPNKGLGSLSQIIRLFYCLISLLVSLSSLIFLIPF